MYLNAPDSSYKIAIMATATTPRDKFDAAVRVIRSLPKNGSFQPSNEMMLKFYAFYKQATEGQCTAPKPNFWDVVKKAKWEAWSKLGSMSREEAMCSYVDQLKTIVEAMPQTQLVAEFVEKLGSFYELVDDKTFSEKFSCQNGDIPNGDVFDHSDNRKVNGNLNPSALALLPCSDPSMDVNKNCANINIDEVIPIIKPGVNAAGSDDDDDHSTDDDDDDDSAKEDGGIEMVEEANGGFEDDRVNGCPELKTSAVSSTCAPRVSQVTSDTDSDVEYCDTIDDLHKAQGIVEDSPSVTNSSDNDQVFTLSPIKQNSNNSKKMLTKLRKSAGQALAGITTKHVVTPINSAVSCEPVFDASTHPFVYVPNRKCSTDSMLVNVPSRQSVSEVDHECSVNGILQDDPKCSSPAVTSPDAAMDVTAHGGEEGDEKHNRKISRRLTSSGYGATSRNLPRGQNELGYCPGDQLASYQGSNPGRGGRSGGEAPEPLRPAPNITEQIAIALSRLQSDLDIVLQRLDTLEKNSPKEDKVSYSWWPFRDVSMKTFLFFSFWPILVHWVFHMAAKRKSK